MLLPKCMCAITNIGVLLRNHDTSRRCGGIGVFIRNTWEVADVQVSFKHVEAQSFEYSA